MTTTTRPQAIWIDCPGMSNPLQHAMLDHCWSCAPYWQRIPTCPVDGKMLRQRTRMPTGAWKPETSGYCRTCRKHYELGEEPEFYVKNVSEEGQP